MLGESKSAIFDIIPEKYIPITHKLAPDTGVDAIKNIMTSNGLQYPVILKPDVGERGWMVRKIKNDEELKTYLDEIKVDFLIQEYIDLPLELGVFYYRFPNEPNGRVSSIVAKEMLFITGDGQQTIQQLIDQKPRARLQIEELTKTYDASFFEQVLPAGQKLELVSIGNHCKGTKFLNGNDWIDDELHQAMDQVAREIPGFYFGRFDLRCSSMEDLRQLRNFKIMELNGAGAEPGHIYQPGYPLLKAYQSIYHHIRVLSRISYLNKKNGTPYWTKKQGLAKLKEIRAYNRQKD